MSALFNDFILNFTQGQKKFDKTYLLDDFITCSSELVSMRSAREILSASIFFGREYCATRDTANL